MLFSVKSPAQESQSPGNQAEKGIQSELFSYKI